MNQQFLTTIFQYLDNIFDMNYTHITRPTTSIDRIVLHEDGTIPALEVVEEIQDVFGLTKSTSLICLEAWLIKKVLMYEKILEHKQRFTATEILFDIDTSLNNIRGMIGWLQQFT